MCLYMYVYIYIYIYSFVGPSGFTALVLLSGALELFLWKEDAGVPTGGLGKTEVWGFLVNKNRQTFIKPSFGDFLGLVSDGRSDWRALSQEKLPQTALPSKPPPVLSLGPRTRARMQNQNTNTTKDDTKDDSNC